jgi:hypothetical protein
MNQLTSFPEAVASRVPVIPGGLVGIGAGWALSAQDVHTGTPNLDGVVQAALLASVIGASCGAAPHLGSQREEKSYAARDVFASGAFAAGITWMAYGTGFVYHAFNK